MKTVTLELDDTVYTLLEVLTRGESAPQRTVEGVIYELIDHALAQKILRRRPDLDELFVPVGV